MILGLGLELGILGLELGDLGVGVEVEVGVGPFGVGDQKYRIINFGFK